MTDLTWYCCTQHSVMEVDQDQASQKECGIQQFWFFNCFVGHQTHEKEHSSAFVAFRDGGFVSIGWSKALEMFDVENKFRCRLYQDSRDFCVKAKDFLEEFLIETEFRRSSSQIASQWKNFFFNIKMGDLICIRAIKKGDKPNNFMFEREFVVGYVLSNNVKWEILEKLHLPATIDKRFGTIDQNRTLRWAVREVKWTHFGNYDSLPKNTLTSTKLLARITNEIAKQNLLQCVQPILAHHWSSLKHDKKQVFLKNSCQKRKIEFADNQEQSCNHDNDEEDDDDDDDNDCNTPINGNNSQRRMVLIKRKKCVDSMMIE